MKALKYRIAIQGTIGQEWSAYFSGMSLTSDSSGITRLSGEVADQSSLHGLLNRIRDLNLRLISVQLLDDDGITPAECRFCPRNKPPVDGDTAANTSLGG